MHALNGVLNGAIAVHKWVAIVFQIKSGSNLSVNWQIQRVWDENAGIWQKLLIRFVRREAVNHIGFLDDDFANGNFGIIPDGLKPHNGLVRHIQYVENAHWVLPFRGGIVTLNEEGILILQLLVRKVR